MPPLVLARFKTGTVAPRGAGQNGCSLVVTVGRIKPPPDPPYISSQVSPYGRSELSRNRATRRTWPLAPCSTAGSETMAMGQGVGDALRRVYGCSIFLHGRLTSTCVVLLDHNSSCLCNFFLFYRIMREIIIVDIWIILDVMLEC
jgi:hypothetical protein